MSATSLTLVRRKPNGAVHEINTLLPAASLLLAASTVSNAVGLKPIATPVAATTAVASADSASVAAVVATRRSPFPISPGMA